MPTVFFSALVALPFGALAVAAGILSSGIGSMTAAFAPGQGYTSVEIVKEIASVLNGLLLSVAAAAIASPFVSSLATTANLLYHEKREDYDRDPKFAVPAAVVFFALLILAFFALNDGHPRLLPFLD
jgi:hypothetical protein